MKKSLPALIMALAVGSLSAATWTPETVSTYSWDGDWVLARTETYEYDAQGRVISHTVAHGGRQEYTYNENGQIAVSTQFYLDDDETNYVPYYRNIYEYDEIVPTFCISETSEQYTDGNWKLTGLNEKIIVRNADGNVESFTTRSTYYYTEDPYVSETHVYNVEYDENGVADAIVGFQTNWSTMEEEESIRIEDIVWENTDGQILLDGYSLAVNNMGLYTGANRIMSATVTGYRENDVDVLAEYASENDYYVVITEGETTLYLFQYETLDENGSNKYRNFSTSYYGETDSIGETVLDEFGIATETKVITITNWGENTVSTRTTVVMDPESGLPVETTTARSEDGETYNNYERKLYINPTVGIHTVQATPTDSEAEYFDLSGRRVSDTTPGFYICRKGTEVFKIMVR